MRVFSFLSPVIFSFGLVGVTAEIESDKFDPYSVQAEYPYVAQSDSYNRDKALLHRQQMSDLRSQVSALRNEVTILKGTIEAMENDMKTINSRMSTEFKIIQKELKQIREIKETEARMGTDAYEADYQFALKALQDGEFAKAQKLFDVFLIKYPKSELADNALFWLAESFYARKKYNTAVVKFQDLVEKFPKSSKRCDAMERQILCLSALNMKAEATAFEKVKASKCSKKTNKKKTDKKQ